MGENCYRCGREPVKVEYRSFGVSLGGLSWSGRSTLCPECIDQVCDEIGVEPPGGDGD